MEPTHTTQARAWARDQALSLLQRLTVSASIAAVAGVGIFGAVSAATIPGTPASTSASSSAVTGSSTSDSSSASSAVGTIQPSSGVSSSTGRGVTVTGGS